MSERPDLDPARRPPGPGGRRRATPRIALLTVLAVLAVVLAGGSGWAIYKIDATNASIQHIAVCQPGENQSDGCLPLNQNPNGKSTGMTAPTPKCFVTVCNYLILGSDSRAGLSKKEQSNYGSTATLSGQRSDTIMLVQVNIPKGRTTILSIPRDLYVPIPGHGSNKINVAFDYGPATTIRTVEALTGVTINHYIDVDFVGFMDLVNAIGGVPICVSQAMHDAYSHLDLPHPGCYTLKGTQALAFVRARHLPNEAIPDFSRIARQQQFMRAVMAKISNPLVSAQHFGAILSALHKGVYIDQNMNVYDLQDLSRKLDSIGQAGVEFRTLPSVPFTMAGIDYLQLQQPVDRQIFQRLRKHQPLGNLGKQVLGTPPTPASINVQIYDAGNPAMAQRLDTFLKKAGFAVLGVAPAPAGATKSRIYFHGSAQQAAVNVVAGYLPGIQVTLSHSISAPHADVTIVVAPGFVMKF